MDWCCKQIQWIGLFLLGMSLWACGPDRSVGVVESPGEVEIQAQILEQIQNRGTLIAGTEYNSHTYFLYRGQPMGYQYDLLNAFAEHLGVKLEVQIITDLEQAFEGLESGAIDILAVDLAVTSDRSQRMDFSLPINQTRQVLVQRKPEAWRKMATMDEVEAQLIRNPLELARETVFVQKGTSYRMRLENLSREIGDSIFWVEDSIHVVEELIAMVAEGEIDFTVADEHVGLVNAKYHPDIDVRTAISFPQNLAWGVKKGALGLKREIDQWLEPFAKSNTYAFLYNKYFRNPRSAYIARSEYNSLRGGKISPYDEVLRLKSDEIDWDWRLVASLVCQESAFNPNSRSWVGAFGLMQLMPATAALFGVDSTATNQEQIAAGLRFIKWLDTKLENEITNPRERIKFVLASYNVGIGHVLDARRLARKYDKDPNIWTHSVDSFLLQKSLPRFYKDPVVQYGYCRGLEPFKYVNEILERYAHYQNLID